MDSRPWAGATAALIASLTVAVLVPAHGPALLGGAALATAAMWAWSSSRPPAPGPSTSTPEPPPRDGAIDQFLYLVSHELTEPLRTASTFTAILLEDHGAELGEEGREKARFAAEAVDRMKARLDLLLRVSRAGRGTRTQVPLAEALQAARSRLIASGPPGGLAVEVDGELPVVRADREGLVGVFEHLLRNARDFASGDPEIRVRASVDPTGVTVEVRDRGVGIDPAHRKDAFRAFWSRDPRSTTPRPGEGLAFCERFVHRHGGWITIDPANPGTVVRFHLPVESAP